MAILYGTYQFPSPSPIVSIGDEPIYVNGEIDSSLTQIQLIGTITGSSLTTLSEKKKELILELAKRYLTLNVEGNSFTYCKPVSVSFSDSDLTTILPYSVEFERYDDKVFSSYFGILNPIDTWSFQEQQNRLVQATHTVSANGVTIDGTDPLENAKTFVNSRFNGFENLSVFNSQVSTAFLQTKSEEIDRFTNSYGVTEVYSFTTSANPINENAIINASTQITYSKSQDPATNVSVNGNIIGSITGSAVTKSMFSPEDAKAFAIKSILDCKSSYESNIYDAIVNGPVSYNYETQEEANRIAFSFQFTEKSDEVLNEYTVSVSASKDSNTISVSVDGKVTYNSHEDAYAGGDIEDWARYLKVVAFFEALNPYNFAVEGFADFLSGTSEYETSSYLNPNAITESVSKNPYEPSVSYSYGYDNKVEKTGLKNFSFQSSDDQVIDKAEIRESNNGFAVTPTSKMLGRFSVSASASTCGSESATLSALKVAVNDLLDGKTCHLIEEGSSSSVESVSYNKTYYYS